jgi:hypothetical protein
MTKLLITALLASPISLFAQRTAFPPPPAPIAQDPPMFYVPFNDRGKWGFSDTLGNMVIAPVFDDVDRFFKQADRGGVVISATVTCKGKKDEIGYRVNRRWSFVVYLGQVNGEAVLVGKNGTKYYRLKR